MAGIAVGQHERPPAVRGGKAVERRRDGVAQAVHQPLLLGVVGVPDLVAERVIGRVERPRQPGRRILQLQHEATHRGHHCPAQGHLDHVAAAALLAGVERQRHRDRAVNRGVGRAQRQRCVHRRRLHPAPHHVQVGEQPGGGSHHPLIGVQRCAPLLVGEEPRQRQVHQAGIGRGQLLRPQAQPRHHPGPKVLDHHVRGLRQPARRRLAGRRLEVQLQPLLAAVQHRVHRGGGARRACAHRSGACRATVRVTRAVDLDHLRPLIGEQHPGQRPRQIVSEIDNSHSLHV